MKKICTLLLLSLFFSLPSYAQKCTVNTKFTQYLCNGHSFVFDDTVITTAGTYYDTLQTANSCDSIIALTITIYTSKMGSMPLTLCDGDSIYWGHQFRKESGTYYDTTLNFLGCDSVTQLVLDFKPQPVKDTTVHVCKGKTININSRIYATAGTYIQNFARVPACDSLLIVHVLVDSVFKQTLYDTLCKGQTYNFYGKALVNSGIYNKVFTSKSGCDSTVSLNILFKANAKQPVISQLGKDTLKSSIIADEYLWYLNGVLDTSLHAFKVKITKSGTYTLVLQTGTCYSDTSAGYYINLTVTDLEDMSITNGATIFPNPNQGVFTLQLTQGEIVKITDVTGKEMIQRELNAGKNTLDLSFLPNGIYIVSTSRDRLLMNITK